MADPVLLTPEEALLLAEQALLGAGARADAARSLAEATVSAHLHHRPEVGFTHLADYISAYREGRIRPDANPVFTRPFPAFLEGDADGGIAQLGFDLAFDALIEAAETFGIAIFTQRNGFTTGELGHYVRRIAVRGLVGLAFTNANAFMAPRPGLPRLFSTNPLAFAYPLGEGAFPVVIDQSASATAFVNVTAAARNGERLAEGVAVDAQGEPTTDPLEAIGGALLPFGGRKGANIALLVELMAAGLSGGAWSADMPDFQSGSETLDSGLTVIAIRPGSQPGERQARGAEFAARLLATGLHVPGLSRSDRVESIAIDGELHGFLGALAGMVNP